MIKYAIKSLTTGEYWVYFNYDYNRPVWGRVEDYVPEEFNSEDDCIKAVANFPGFYVFEKIFTVE